MAKTITINAPGVHSATSANKAGAKEGDLCESTITGRVAWLYVRNGFDDPAPVKVKCFLVLEHGKAVNVSHYASGCCLRRIGGARLDYQVAFGRVPSNQVAAQIALDTLVKTHGKDNVLAEMSKQDVRNP